MLASPANEERKFLAGARYSAPCLKTLCLLFLLFSAVLVFAHACYCFLLLLPTPSSESSNRQCESTEMATNGDAFTESREKASGTSSTQVSATSHSKRKLRGLDGVQRPRKKFRRCTLEVWREVCQNATNVYDEDLPSMEEASRMFGYAC